MLSEFLYWIVYRLSDIHGWILKLNDAYEYNLSDKALHFLVIGAVGMVMYFVIHPIIRALTKRGRVAVISWFYVLTLIVVLTFGIEIGQKITGTGAMEFADVVFGVGGFLAFFAVYAVIHTAVAGLRRIWKKKHGGE